MTSSKESSKNLMPQRALESLMEGNKRFLNNQSLNRDLQAAVDKNRDGQKPFAAVLSCADSRVPVEIVFDQGVGDVFSVRLAGNIASINAIASLEFSCKYLGSSLIVVLGHTKCGAVKGACDNVQLGSLDQLFKYIRPAIDAEKEIADPARRNSGDADFLNKVTHLNVEQQITTILDNSPLLRDMLANQQIAIVGAVYDVETGKVTIQEEDKVFNCDHQFDRIKEHIIH